jgi:sulfatase modifying factor 1
MAPRSVGQLVVSVCVATGLGCGTILAIPDVPIPASDDGGSSSSSGGSGSGGSSSGSSGSSKDSSGGGSSGTSTGDGGAEAGADGGSTGSPPSCAPGGPGLTNCGPGGSGAESCCGSVGVGGGTFYRTYDDDNGTLAADGGPTALADPATISTFALDKYLVTVGRFRQFVNAWNGGAGYTPPAGSGKHTYLNGGRGLANGASPGTYESGWVASDDVNVAPTDTNLACPYSTWTASPGENENLPSNCVNWYEAEAFCIWDGGFLPSDAEWEYAAAGGSQQREYPWGSTAPGTNNQYAIYALNGVCYYPSGGSPCPQGTGLENYAPVGTATLGAGLWGQLDLAGEVWEWNLDATATNGGAATYEDPCTDCADLTAGSSRVMRGGNQQSQLFSSLSSSRPPTERDYYLGFRCARAPAYASCNPPGPPGPLVCGLPNGTTPAFYSCSQQSDCIPNTVCVDNGGDHGYYCKPTCTTMGECEGFYGINMCLAGPGGGAPCNIALCSNGHSSGIGICESAGSTLPPAFDTASCCN